MKNSLYALIVPLLTLLVFDAGQYSKKPEIERLQSRLDRILRHWDRKSGGTQMIEGASSYNLQTFDSGKHWYAVEYDKDWGMSIIGEANQVFPNLLDHLASMDNLSSYVETNGPLTLQDGADGQEAKLLQSAGFKIENFKLSTEHTNRVCADFLNEAMAVSNVTEQGVSLTRYVTEHIESYTVYPHMPTIFCYVTTSQTISFKPEVDMVIETDESLEAYYQVTNEQKKNEVDGAINRSIGIKTYSKDAFKAELEALNINL